MSSDVGEITKEQIADKKKIGFLRGHTVWAVTTKGGYNFVVCSKSSNKMEVLGVGPLKAVALHIASERNPDLQLTELQKGDYIDPSAYEHLLPKYRAATTKLAAL